MPDRREKKGRLRTRIGVTATVVWFLGVGILLYWDWESASQMPPNAWGDFVAGVTAPVAFFWLILGYYQQGDELQLNTKAVERFVVLHLFDGLPKKFLHIGGSVQ